MFGSPALIMKYNIFGRIQHGRGKKSNPNKDSVRHTSMQADPEILTTAIADFPGAVDNA